MRLFFNNIFLERNLLLLSFIWRNFIWFNRCFLRWWTLLNFLFLSRLLFKRFLGSYFFRFYGSFFNFICLVNLFHFNICLWGFFFCWFWFFIWVLFNFISVYSFSFILWFVLRFILILRFMIRNFTDFLCGFPWCCFLGRGFSLNSRHFNLFTLFVNTHFLCLFNSLCFGFRDQLLILDLCFKILLLLKFLGFDAWHW